MLTAHKAGLIATPPHLMLQDLSRLLQEVTPPDQAHQENSLPPLCSTCGRESQRPYKPFSGKKCYSVFSNWMSQIYGHAHNDCKWCPTAVVSPGVAAGASERRATEMSCESRTVIASAALVLHSTGSSVWVYPSQIQANFFINGKNEVLHTHMYCLISMKTNKASFL